MVARKEIERLMTTAQVAEWLQVHPKTIKKWIRRREFPFQRVGIRLRFTQSLISRWLQQRGEEQ
jgi:excisionase family DNA binding protein